MSKRDEGDRIEFTIWGRRGASCLQNNRVYLGKPEENKVVGIWDPKTNQIKDKKGKTLAVVETRFLMLPNSNRVQVKYVGKGFQLYGYNTPIGGRVERGGLPQSANLAVAFPFIEGNLPSEIEIPCTWSYEGEPGTVKFSKFKWPNRCKASLFRSKYKYLYAAVHFSYKWDYDSGYRHPYVEIGKRNTEKPVNIGEYDFKVYMMATQGQVRIEPRVYTAPPNPMWCRDGLAYCRNVCLAQFVQLARLFDVHYKEQ